MKFISTSPPNLLLLTAVFYGFILVIAALLIYFYNIEWLSWFHFKPITIFWSLIFGGLSAYLLLRLESFIGFTNTQLGSDFIKLMKLIGKQPTYALLIISVAAGICEEVLFRAILQDLGIKHFGVITGIVSVSILFGLLHSISISYFLYATFIGLILGILYYLTEDLISLITLHATFDFVALYVGTHFYGLVSKDSTTELP